MRRWLLSAVFLPCTIIFRSWLYIHTRCYYPQACVHKWKNTRKPFGWINHARTQPRKIKTRFDEDLLNFEPFNNRTRKRLFRVRETRVREKERSYRIPTSFFIFGQFPWYKQTDCFMFSKWIGIKRVITDDSCGSEITFNAGGNFANWRMNRRAHAWYKTPRLARFSLAVSIDYAARIA